MASMESMSRALREDADEDFEYAYEMEAREAMGREWSSAERLPVRGIDGRVRTAEYLLASKERAKAITSGKQIRPYSITSNSVEMSEESGSEDLEAAGGGGAEAAAEYRPARREADAPAALVKFSSWKQYSPARRARSRHSAKLQIAGLCEALVTDPESAVFAPKPPPPPADGGTDAKKRKKRKRKSPMAQLQSLCAADDPVIRSLALASELAVLQDILPGYRVRLPTQAEIEEYKLSKDVRSAWKFERALLDAYEGYLSALGACIELHPSGKGRLRRDAALVFAGVKRVSYEMDAGPKALRSIALTAAKCLCELLQSHSHFNHSELVVRATVALGDCGEPELESTAHDALKQMFSMDPTGYASSEAAEAISKRVKKRGPRVSMGLLETMSKLRIRRLIADDKAARRKKDQQEDGTGQRKPDNDEVEIALKAMDADERDLRKKANEKALKAAVTALFRLLKHPKGTIVLGPVLQALGRFVHLIDVEVASDVLAALQDITDRSTLSVVEDATKHGGIGGAAQGDSDAEGSDYEGSKGSAASGKPQAFAAGASASLEDDRSGAILNEDELAVVREGAGAQQASRVKRGSKQSRNRRRYHVLLNEQPLGKLPLPITLDPSVAFELVSAAAWIIAGPGQSLGYDSAAFGTFLYRAMTAMPLGGREAVGSSCRAVALYLLRRREPDPQIAAAFAKRCLVMSLQVDTYSQASLLQLFRYLIGSYSELEYILDRVQDRVYGGTYQIDGMSLEKCAGLAAPTFELADLALRSWHPKIRSFAAGALAREVVSPADAPVAVIKSSALATPDASCGFAGLPAAVSKDHRFAEVLQAAAEEASEATGADYDKVGQQDDLAVYESTMSGLESLSLSTYAALDRLASQRPGTLLPLPYGFLSDSTGSFPLDISDMDEDAAMLQLEAVVLGRQATLKRDSDSRGKYSGASNGIETASLAPLAGGKRKRDETAKVVLSSTFEVARRSGTGRIVAPESATVARSGAKQAKARREKARKKRRKEGLSRAVVQPATVETYKAKLVEKYGNQKHKWTGPVGKASKGATAIVAPGIGAVRKSALTTDPGKPMRRKASKAERLQQRIARMKAGRDAMRFDR